MRSIQNEMENFTNIIVILITEMRFNLNIYCSNIFHKK